MVKENNIGIDQQYYEELKVFFNNSRTLLEKLEQLHIKKKEIMELRENNGKLQTPMVITLSGTPRSGKTSCLEILVDFFKKTNLKVKQIDEPAGIIYSKLKNKEEKQKLLADRVGFVEQQYELGDSLINQHLLDSDIILCDRGIIDTFIWYDMYYQMQMMNEKRYNSFLEKMNKKVSYTNKFYALYSTTFEAMKRDYLCSLSLEPRTTLSEENIERYISSLLRIYPLVKEKIHSSHLIDTTKISIMDTSIIIANDILEEVKTKYLRRD